MGRVRVAMCVSTTMLGAAGRVELHRLNCPHVGRSAVNPEPFEAPASLGVSLRDLAFFLLPE